VGPAPTRHPRLYPFSRLPRQRFSGICHCDQHFSGWRSRGRSPLSPAISAGFARNPQRPDRPFSRFPDAFSNHACEGRLGLPPRRLPPAWPQIRASLGHRWKRNFRQALEKSKSCGVNYFSLLGPGKEWHFGAIHLRPASAILSS
jgi:hypothetical protein